MKDAVDCGKGSNLVLARGVPAAVEVDRQPEGAGNRLTSTVPSAHERCESVRARIQLCARSARGRSESLEPQRAHDPGLSGRVPHLGTQTTYSRWRPPSGSMVVGP